MVSTTVNRSTNNLIIFLIKYITVLFSDFKKKEKRCIIGKIIPNYNHLALDTWSVNGSGSSLPIPGMYP